MCRATGFVQVSSTGANARYGRGCVRVLGSEGARRGIEEARLRLFGIPAARHSKGVPSRGGKSSLKGKEATDPPYPPLICSSTFLGPGGSKGRLVKASRGSRRRVNPRLRYGVARECRNP